MQIREILTLKSDAIHSIAPTDSVESAVAKLVSLGVGSLVVLKNGEMVGLLTERDVVHGMVKQGCDLKDAEVSTIMVTEPVGANACRFSTATSCSASSPSTMWRAPA